MTNGHAGPSRPTASAAAHKKRPIELLSAENEGTDEFEVNGNGLDLDDGEGVSDLDEDEDDDEEGDGADEGEAFPELDSGSENGEGVEDGTESEYEDLDDEDSGSESGYNSSDIERRYDSSPVTSPSSSSQNLTTDDKLSRMIGKSSVKPDETLGTDAKVSRAKEGTGRLVKSRLVEGGYKREYEDVEAGYGSESSTEEVSARWPTETISSRFAGDARFFELTCHARIPIRSVTSRWSGMTISRTLATTSTAANSSDQRRAMNWINSWQTLKIRTHGHPRRTSSSRSRSS